MGEHKTILKFLNNPKQILVNLPKTETIDYLWQQKSVQRIAVAERYRPIYEKQAKENQGTRNDLKNNITVNLPQSPKKQKRNPTTDKKLSDIATVSEKTYRMGAKVLHSDNKDVKRYISSGENSTNKIGKSKF